MTTHGGNMRMLAEEAGCAPGDIIDFSANINPLGPPEWLRREIARSIEEVVHYPDPNSLELVREIAKYHHIDEHRVVVGNGAEELLFALPRALDAKRVLLHEPSYIDYRVAAEHSRCEVVGISSAEGFRFNRDEFTSCISEGDLIILGHPNNPTGIPLDISCVEKIIQSHPKAAFLIDEAFIDFIEDAPSFLELSYPNLYVLRSMTKFYAIAGLRLGYLITPIGMPNFYRQLGLPAWNVNTFAQRVGVRALQDGEYQKNTRRNTTILRTELKTQIQKIPGISQVTGEANYLFFQSEKEIIRDYLLHKYRIAIRSCDNYTGLETGFFRVAVRSEEENKKLLLALRTCLGIIETPSKVRSKKHTPAMMIQGCSSNAGKSIIAAALCRVLMQDGYKVAPFKSQNMSLNSYVTREGYEISRAQVVQSQACRRDPDIRMNPILLKPNSHTGSQVIVNGTSVGNMSVMEYVKYKPTAFREAQKAYDSLASENEVMILEGAGSPGEVNLKSHDIVNMNMARYAKSPVVLVGDIDRGGVFASFVGTMEVCHPWERDLIAGFLVNRFRGDARLLDDAFTYCLDHTAKPVLGVVDYIAELGLPEEDSVSFRDGKNCNAVKEGAVVDLAVLDLKHFANISDIDALLEEPDLNVRVTRDPKILKLADVILIPGSKNTISDLMWIQESGLGDIIAGCVAEGVEVVGICGGFQMLGETVSDPHRIESKCDTVSALGFLPIETSMAPTKSLHQVELQHLRLGETIRGYEIHHGTTTARGGEVIFERDGELVGLSQGCVWGSYLHGIFDNDKFRREWINSLRVRKGCGIYEGPPTIYNLEEAFDRLAETFRRGTDLTKLYSIIGL